MAAHLWRPRRAAVVWLALAWLALAWAPVRTPSAFVGQPRLSAQGHIATRCRGPVVHRKVAAVDVPDVAKPGYQNRFYTLAAAEAAKHNITPDAYLESIETAADEWMASEEILDREDFQAALAEAIRKVGRLTLVLGGKSLGKTLVKKKVIKQIQGNPGIKVTVVSIDMRAEPPRPLLDLLVEKAAVEIERLQLPGAGELLRAITVFLPGMQDRGALGAVVTKSFEGLVQRFITKAQTALDEVISNFTSNGYTTSFVVDEANAALPDGGDPSAARQALRYVVKLTKQDKEASVVLISSDFAYPYRLQEAGLDLFDIGDIILAGEAPKEDTIDLFVQQWGMGQELAELFHEYYGGSVLHAHRAVQRLIRQRQSFRPFSILDSPGLMTCLEDPAARAHLVNLCERGFSHVQNIKSDVGARLIVQNNIGGIISDGTLTFGLPGGMWDGTTCKYAVVPSSSHMRLQICQELAANVQQT